MDNKESRTGKDRVKIHELDFFSVRQGTGMELLELNDRYYDRVKSFIMRLVKDEWVADDLIQETFIRVQGSIHSVRDPSKISSWIFRIAYNWI